MSFKTHRVGGNWLGGGEVIPNCNEAAQRAITLAFDDVHTTAVAALTALGGLDSLITCLNGKTVTSVEIDCDGPGCGGGSLHGGDAGSNSINICSNTLPGGETSQLMTNAAVFHEFIHMCGGGELDAYALQDHCYHDRSIHPVIPLFLDVYTRQTSDVGNGLRAGAFVVWEPATGIVFVKVATGGNWLSGPTISRGTRLNTVPFRR